MELNSVIANRTQNWGVFSSKPGGDFLVLVRQPHRQKTRLDGAVLLEPRSGVIGRSPTQQILKLYLYLV
ncbi:MULTISPECIES: hypothetical protein [unclassified Nostoc]|uniref:hypothetical protein n=1 Tax=unclassified Nostoc TaxID=2593658 RepID=UPI000B954602|nr:hypothetical protein [Nostoc sp. 'Peltigera membranacea cyanobiont' 232]OYE01281.1 hypothetical protein CDG79_30530 [Nostoc sp. 'Peltigera membranacea cyanobiont' 232]